MRTGLRLLLTLLPTLAAPAAAQDLVDWDFSSLTNPGVADAPIASPLLPASASGVHVGLACSGLFGGQADPSFTGLRWAASNPAPGELNLRYFDGDASDLPGTADDGVSDNYLTFTLTSQGLPLEVSRLSVSVWRNGAGAPGRYAFEVLVDGGPPQAFGAVQDDPVAGDPSFDWFHFDDQVVATSSLEIRFRPVALPGGQGTGNLHVNALRVVGPEGPPPGPGPNVLFLIADDLTANALGCYGNPLVSTPHIDALAQRGLRFDRAYCQYPVCDASRASLMSGWYPQRIQAGPGSFTNLEAAIGAHPTLAEHFRGNGYTSARVSKIFHMRVPGDITSGSSGPDHAPSWDWTHNVTAPEWNTPGTAGHYTTEALTFDPNQHYNLGFGAAFYAVESSTSGAEQADFLAADAARERLGVYQQEPFFLAVGLVRPHVPLVATPAEFGLYDPSSLPLAPSLPNDLADVPGQGVFWNESSRGPLNDPDRRSVLQAYYAAVTFMDTQVGRVLDRLDELGLAETTIVVFTSDHGYHLGEHTFWQKLSLHEESARVPLIVAGPGIAAGSTDSLAELIDLYPTLAERCGLAIPAECQGVSLGPVLDDPTAEVRGTALSRVAPGDLLRTPDLAYMRYSGGGEELYDMVADPLQFTNRAGDPSYAAQLDAMRALMDARLGAALDTPIELLCTPASPHAAGGAVTLAASSLGSATASGLHLEALDGPPGEFGYFLVGTGGSGSVVQSNGVFCLQAPLARYSGNVASVLGLPGLDSIGRFDAAGVFQNLAGTAPSTGGTGFDVPALLPFPPAGQALFPGDTWYFQLWYRDQPLGSANWSDVVQVRFP